MDDYGMNFYLNWYLRGSKGENSLKIIGDCMNKQNILYMCNVYSSMFIVILFMVFK